MSSYMTWALIDDKLANINQFSIEENKNNTKNGTAKCVCCGESLISNTGEIKNWYYRHRSKSKCRGSLESVVHKYAKDVFKTLNTFNMPDINALFKSNHFCVCSGTKINLDEYDINIEKNLTKSIRPDIILEHKINKNIICIEFYVTNKKNRSSINKYNTYIKKTISDKLVNNISVVEVDLRGVSDEINKNCTNEDDIIKRLKLFLSQDNISQIVTSTELVKINLILGTSYHISNNKDILCPASDNKYIFSHKDCRKCPFVIKASKDKVECYGKTCIISEKDVLKLLKSSSNIDDSLKELEDPDSELYENYKDINSDIINNLTKLYSTNKPNKTMLGNCKNCGTELQLSVGKQANNFKKFSTNLSENNEYLYRYCPKCNKYESVLCPYCKSKTKLLENRWGRLFIKCDNYLSESEKEHGRTLKEHCPFSLTVYRDNNCNCYEDEIQVIGGLDGLDDLSPNKIKKMLLNCRLNAKSRKEIN